MSMFDTLTPVQALRDAAIAVGPDYSGSYPELNRDSTLKFLLIEDSITDRELILELLDDEFPNAQVDTATSLELAIHQLAQSHYDLILADLTLPDADGGAVVRTVRDAYPQTALMVLTGRVDGGLALWALAEGAQDYLVKGQLDGGHLAEALLHGLQRSRTEQLAHAILVAALTKESEAVHRLGELNRAKTDFVATVSHELRTPLTSLLGYAEMLQEEVLTSRQTGFVDAIARNAGRLTALTDDLLLISGFSSPERRPTTREVDLTAVVSNVQEVLSTLASGRKLTLDFGLPDRPVVVTGDGEHLERVVLNLMSNAIKFSEVGATVSCRLSSTPTEAVLEVTDTGIGIPLEEQGALFTEFFRGSAARDRAIQGTGLGLHIVESIVTSHSGQVSLESAPMEGATFTVRLPLAFPR